MDKPASTVEMSQEYGSTTQTAINFLQSFKHWVLEAIITFQKEIKKIIETQGFLVISDIGCWDGSHFFEPLKEIIVKLRELFGNSFKIKVIYSDLNILSARIFCAIDKNSTTFRNKCRGSLLQAQFLPSSSLFIEYYPLYFGYPLAIKRTVY